MSVIVSGGRPQYVAPKASWPLPTGVPTTMSGQRTIELLRGAGALHASFEAIVKSQPWVFSAVAKLTFWSARIPFKVYDGEMADERERDHDSGLARLMKRPHPRIRWVTFGHEFYFDYYVHGKALILKYRASAGAPPDELWVVPWRLVDPVVDGAGNTVGFNVKIGGGQPVGLTPRDVIYLQWPRGIAPLEALRRTVQVEDAALTYQTQSIKNGVTPRAAFTTDGQLGEPDQKRLRDELAKLYGGVDEAGVFAILHSGLKYDKPIGVSPVDMAIMEQRKFSREEIASVFDISPPFLGILDRATFSNITELRESNYVDSLGPKLDDVQAVIQAQLVDDEPVWDGHYVEYDMGAILKPNPEGQARQALMDMQSGTTSIDERRRLRNQKPFKIAGVTDVPLIAANMIPAGAALDGRAGDSTDTGQTQALMEVLVAEAFRAGQRHVEPDHDEPDE